MPKERVRLIEVIEISKAIKQRGRERLTMLTELLR